MSKKKRCRVCVGFSPNQLQCLSELKDSLGVSYSLLIRTIILDFLTQNEERLQKIVETHNNELDDDDYVPYN